MLIPGKSSIAPAVARFWPASALWPAMLLVLLSASAKSADIKIEVTDPSTGKTTSTYEKTYSPAEKKQFQEGIEQKRAAEDMPSGLAKKVELERRRLQEQADGLRNRELTRPIGRSEPSPETVQNFHRVRDNNVRAIEQQIKELEKDPELYFYKQSQTTKSESKRQHGAVIDPKTGNVIGHY